ncbi:MAG: hypothetical protein CMO80_07700 [Verrucomicrobiales bacterium]|nr:hypothetical protein [Verrucomicrobiales bacterium]
MGASAHRCFAERKMNPIHRGIALSSFFVWAAILALTFESQGQGKLFAASPVSSTAGLISPGDSIEMRVWREDDMTTRATILSDGTVALPLLGDVKIGGMTLKEAKSLIQTLYDRDYLVKPQVFLAHTVSTNTSTFLVLGQVHSPGLISIPRGKKQIDVLDGIGLAGGFTRLARQSKVLVKRKEGNVEKLYEVDAEKLAQGSSKPFMLLDGDKVTVRERIF